MEQHPVPQHIASYEFRLVGDMTLKQFVQLAAGGVLAIIAYALPIPSLFKWPLVVLFGFLGFAFAFLPINERPLSTWLLSFFKAVFSPTQFIWKKKAKKPDVLKPLPYHPSMPQAQPTSLQSDKGELNQYLASLPYGEEKSPLDQQEESFLKEVDHLFQSTPTATVQPQVEPGLGPPLMTPSPTARSMPPKPKIDLRKIIPPPVVLPQKPGRPKKTAVEAKINKELPIPEAPTRPNIITGMVLDHEGKIMEGAILEIRDTQDLPVRALKTNKVGQFIIATPLQNGEYEIEIEKEGYLFDLIKVETKGEIIQPIEIRAKERVATPVNPGLAN